MKVIFNGELVSSQDPKINVSPFSNAIMFGQSVFETFRTYEGRLPGNLKDHWERLFQSAEVLGLEPPVGLDQVQLDTALQALLSDLDLSRDYRFKVLLNTDFWWITASELKPLPSSVYEEGVKVDDVVQIREMQGAKWASPLYPVFQKRHQTSSVFETLYFNPQDELLEGSVTSVIAVIDGVLKTPQNDVLPGITVRVVLEYARILKVPIVLGVISRTELQTASEILLTNAIKGLVPVSEWGGWRRSSQAMFQQLSSFRQN